MINIIDSKECCGCTACASICAHDAITMEPDVLGFLYPKVDEAKCVECGLCEKVCQFNDNYNRSLNLDQPIAYAARHKDINEVMKSRSGAAFVTISDFVLEQGGVVYGAGYKDHFRVVHKRATTKEERDEFRGSKYVQSDLTGVFRQVKDDLKNGFVVLFSGTPCQTSGLNAYVGKKLRQNLVLVDIVCHGVPGPYLWRDFLAYLEQRQGDEIVAVDFRDKKRYGWNGHRESFVFRMGGAMVFRMGGAMTFKELFHHNIVLRKSCGVCHYCNLKRPSDITLADFWGWESTTDINLDNKGVSLILCNTEKGKEIFEKIRSRMYVVQADLQNIMQPNLREPSKLHPYSDQFENDYKKFGFKKTMAKYGYIGWKREMKQIDIYILNKVSQIKKLLHRI